MPTDNYANSNQAEMISSPCVRNCCLNEQDYCLGCYRHLDEIVGWRRYSEAERLAIMAECQQHKLNRSQLNKPE